MSVFSPEPLEFEDQESAQELEELESFNLLLLPNEIILKIINSINERIKIGLFTSGPSNELIQFSLVNKLFYGLITPLIFKSIRFNNLSKIVGGNSNVGVRPLGFKKLRSLTNLVKILNSIKLRNYAPNLEIEELYINLKDEFDSIKFQLKELENFNLLLNLFNFTIKILFLEEIQLDLNGDKFLLSISNLTNLRVLRLNQVDFGHLKIIQNLTNFDNLKTLQIMHGSSQFVRLIFLLLPLACFTNSSLHLQLTLVRKAPKLESLLIWPESRRLASLAPFISQNLLPQLRLLSLDVVNEPTCLLLFASRIKELHAQSIPINLTELFIEGTLRSHEQELLLEALGMTRIKRLALYHIGLVEPRLIGQIAKVLPGLEALTLVQGNTQGSVLWPAPFVRLGFSFSLLLLLTLLYVLTFIS